jgi:hypothetical protein
MNLNGQELIRIPEYLTEVLQDPVATLNDLISNVVLPNLGGLASSFSNLLPSNLINVDSDGNVSLLDPKTLENTINEGINQVSGLVEGQIRTALNQAMGIVSTVTDTAEQAANAISNLGAGIANLNLDYVNNALDSFLSVAGTMGVDTSSISQITNSAQSVISNISNLSPAKLKELQNPELYEQFVQDALNTATGLIKDETIKNALNTVLPSQTISTAIGLALAGVSSFSGGGEKEILVEIDTYYAKGEAADKDAAQYRSVSGKKLQSGKSCAVDNSNILFGSKVQTSLGTFEAVDKAKTSSSTGLPKISLFFEDQPTASQKLLQLTQSNKIKQVVKVTPPNGGGFKPKQLQIRGDKYNLY